MPKDSNKCESRIKNSPHLLSLFLFLLSYCVLITLIVCDVKEHSSVAKWQLKLRVVNY